MGVGTTVDGKRIVITGATNGIGLAAAEALAERGARLTVIARSQARASVVSQRIEAAGGKKADIVLADLSSQAQVRRSPRTWRWRAAFGR